MRGHSLRERLSAGALYVGQLALGWLAGAIATGAGARVAAYACFAFALLASGALLQGLASQCAERLRLRWRASLTRKLLGRYFVAFVPLAVAQAAHRAAPPDGHACHVDAPGRSADAACEN